VSASWERTSGPGGAKQKASITSSKQASKRVKGGGWRPNSSLYYSRAEIGENADPKKLWGPGEMFLVSIVVGGGERPSSRKIRFSFQEWEEKSSRQRSRVPSASERPGEGPETRSHHGEGQILYKRKTPSVRPQEYCLPLLSAVPKQRGRSGQRRNQGKKSEGDQESEPALLATKGWKSDAKKGFLSGKVIERTTRDDRP